MPRIGIFIDSGNQFSAISRLWPGRKLDYCKYRSICESYGEIVFTKVYAVNFNTDSARFIQFLECEGFEATTHHTNSFVRYNWVPQICIDVFDSLETIDMFIFCTATSHLVPLLQFLRRRSKHVTVFAANPQPNLVKFASEIWPIGMDQLEQNAKSPK